MTEIENILRRLEENTSTPCYEQRLAALEAEGFDTRLMRDGVEAASNKLQSGANSFVIYGEPQSGKTEVMILLVCKLIDLGYESIFILMNDNTELETQNYDRFLTSSELNPSPIRDFQLKDLTEAELKQQRRRIVFCRKNSNNLEKLISNARFMKNRIVIDDEADYATPNTRINKKEVSRINERVDQLLSGSSGSVYVGVTATPGRLDLNNTFFNNSKDWVFLEPHAHYKGRSYFFPVSRKQQDESEFNLKLLPDEGDEPRHLRSAICRFLIRTAFLNHQSAMMQRKAYSMLIHTAGKTQDHAEDKAVVDKLISQLLNRKDSALKLLVAEATDLFPNQALRNELLVFVLEYIGQSQVLIINSKNDRTNVEKAGKPKSLFTFAIGGNIVSRGLTFERLLTFFFSRNVKSKLQQNTYIQRARMFGNRPYAEHMELCIPEELYKNWFQCFVDHELSLRLAKAGSYMHIQSDSNKAADAASIDKKSVVIGKGEWEIGDIFDMTPELEEKLLQIKSRPLTMLQTLIVNGDLPDSAINESILVYIKEVCDREEKDVSMVFREGPLSIQDIAQYKDADVPSITRRRGGMIQAITHKRSKYANTTHFLLPVKNKHGKARFVYKANLDATMLQNRR